MSVESICENCGNNFFPKKESKGRYCCLECYWQDCKTILVCEYCDKEFEVRKSEKNKNYCSRECADNDGFGRRDRVELECGICKEKYKVKASRKDRSTYCSKKCQYIGRRKQKKYKKGICKECGEEYKVEERRFNERNRQFCSDSCRKKFDRVGSSVLTKDEYERAIYKFRLKKKVEKISDNYAKALIRNKISINHIPGEILQTKKYHLKLKRQIKEQKNGKHTATKK